MCSYRVTRIALPDQLPQALRTERNLAQLFMLRGKIERILDRLCEQGPDRNRAGLARALDAERIERRGGHDVGELHARDVERARQEIVRKRRIAQLPLVVEHEPLKERVSYPLRHPAMDLTGQDQWVDDRAAVVHDNIFEDLQRQRFGVDLDDHGMDAVCGRAAWRAEILRGFEARLGAGAYRAAHRIGAHCKLAEADRLTGHPDD